VKTVVVSISDRFLVQVQVALPLPTFIVFLLFLHVLLDDNYCIIVIGNGFSNPTPATIIITLGI